MVGSMLGPRGYHLAVHTWVETPIEEICCWWMIVRLLVIR